MTDDILKLMEERRLIKNNTGVYKKLQSVIKKEIQAAKPRWMTEKRKEMADLIAMHDTFNMHGKVKKIAGQYKKDTDDFSR